MKRFWIVMAMACFTAAGALAAFRPKPSFKPVSRLSHSGDIRGVVEYCAHGPAGGVMVYLPGFSFVVITDAQGRFQMCNVPEGVYDLFVQVPGEPAVYEFQEIGVKPKLTTVIPPLSVCDQDQDGVADAEDNCPTTTNPDQADSNRNGIGDACECVDDDQDGYGVGPGCQGPEDCDDNDPDMHPGADEVCGNQIDDNCDGQIDEGCER